MLWIVCCFLSIAALAFAIVYAIVALATRYRAEKPKNPMNALTVGTFVAGFFLHFPMYAEMFGKDILRSILITLHNVICLFVIDADYFFVIDNISAAPAWTQPVYEVFGAVLYVLAPILTFGFILSLFKNLSAHLKYYASFFKDAYYFSELNERSLTLAADIKRNNPHATIVFCDVFEQNEESSFELIERAKELGAIRFKQDILAINFAFHSKKAEKYFFTMSENESENLDQSLKLLQKYGNTEHAHLFVFSTRIESELLLTAAEKGSMKVRRINEVRSLVNRFLYDDGKSLFDGAREQTDGTKLISAVVVGLGSHGTEMVKALTWYCQMIGYRIEIHAFDKDPLAEDKFTALCPELMSERYNGVYVAGEAQYKITIYSGIDVETNAFAQKIVSLTDATFAFVSLGSDERNVQTATNLRMLFERAHIKPSIHAVLRSSQAKEALLNATNYRGQAYGIRYIGDLESSYSEAVILDSELEANALARHLKWGKEEDFWRYEYNYRSSIASALHMRLRESLNIPGANKAEEDLTEAEIAILEPLEHCRWNAYMRSEGYVYSGSPDSASRNDLGKMHHNLVVFDDLSEEDKRKDRRVGSK